VSDTLSSVTASGGLSSTLSEQSLAPTPMIGRRSRRVPTVQPEPECGFPRDARAEKAPPPPSLASGRLRQLWTRHPCVVVLAAVLGVVLLLAAGLLTARFAFPCSGWWLGARRKCGVFHSLSYPAGETATYASSVSLCSVKAFGSTTSR
jgi:hypothetical protein